MSVDKITYIETEISSINDMLKNLSSTQKQWINSFISRLAIDLKMSKQDIKYMSGVIKYHIRIINQYINGKDENLCDNSFLEYLNETYTNGYDICIIDYDITKHIFASDKFPINAVSNNYNILDNLLYMRQYKLIDCLLERTDLDLSYSLENIYALHWAIILKHDVAHRILESMCYFDISSKIDNIKCMLVCDEKKKSYLDNLKLLPDRHNISLFERALENDCDFDMLYNISLLSPTSATEANIKEKKNLVLFKKFNKCRHKKVKPMMTMFYDDVSNLIIDYLA